MTAKSNCKREQSVCCLLFENESEIENRLHSKRHEIHFKFLV